MFSWCAADTAYADFKIGSKKAEKRNQVLLEKSIDALNHEAELLFHVEDSFDYAIEILKEAYSQADQANYTKGIISSANLLVDGYLFKTDFSNVTSKYYIAMRQAETIMDSSSMAKAYRGLGLVKFNMKQ
jgi:hypothetical protein